MGENQIGGRLVTPALVLARAATMPMSTITSYLLIEIGHTFQQPVGVVSQIRTTNSIIAVVVALLMGVISVKFKPKSLVVSGLALIAVSALGCCLTPSFLLLLLVFPIAGIGTAMLTPMANTLVGIHLPRERRPGAIGWMMTGMAAIGILGGFVINFLNGMGGWRLAFMGYALPVALIIALLVQLWIPGSGADAPPSTGGEGLLSGFRQVYMDKSALSCLLGIAVSQTTWQAMLLFGNSFYRQQFSISLATIPLLSIGSTLCYIGGNLFTGRYANRLGNKRLSILSLLLSGVSMAIIFISPDFWIAYAFVLLFALVSGVRATSTQSHTMEQMTRARGTLMSCMSASISLGATMGAAIGGYILLGYDYAIFGYVFSAINIIGALIFWLLTTEKN